MGGQFSKDCENPECVRRPCVRVSYGGGGTCVGEVGGGTGLDWGRPCELKSSLSREETRKLGSYRKLGMGHDE